MAITFGPFELDEPRRVLLLDGRELSLQPKVFELLVHLVRNRDQVVSKDELMSLLWPDVTVTEGSLQRAASLLRAVLRKGGMETSLRSFPRIGYRFCIDEKFPAGEIASPDRAEQVLAAARSFHAEQRWQEAASQYAAADADIPLGGKDLEAWAHSLQCIGRPIGAIPLLIRAVTKRIEAGESAAAAADAVTLATLHLERGEVAVAKGWLARAEALTSHDENTPAAGHIYWMQSRILASEGDPQRGLELADRAYELGRRLGYMEVEALGLMYRGFMKLSLGDTRGGLTDQDHAAALALSSNCDPMTGSTLYCNILWACRTFGDWARANQWTIGYQRFSNRSNMEFSGSCQLHRAEVLGVHGSLSSAVEHVEDALERLKDDAPWALGDAYRVIGDLHAAAGDGEAAFLAYEKAYAAGWDPEPGHAMLLLETGEAEAAYASLERSIVGQSWWTLQRRGILHAHLALAAAHTGRLERAAALVEELTASPERWPMASIRALTNEVSAILAKERGDRALALHHLHLARQLWTSIESVIQAARVRLIIAELQLEMGDTNGAAVEVRATLAAARVLGSAKFSKACQALEETIARAPTSDGTH